jgi:hypothetical protein
MPDISFVSIVPDTRRHDGYDRRGGRSPSRYGYDDRRWGSVALVCAASVSLFTSRVVRWCGNAGVLMTSSEAEEEVGMTVTVTKEGILIALKVKTSPSDEVRFC